MSDAAPSLDDMIAEMDITILGAEEWIARAMRGEIKRPPEVIEHNRQRLATRRRIREALVWMRDRKGAAA